MRNISIDPLPAHPKQNQEERRVGRASGGICFSRRSGIVFLKYFEIVVRLGKFRASQLLLLGLAVQPFDLLCTAAKQQAGSIMVKMTVNYHPNLLF